MKHGKNLIIKKSIEKAGIENIEVKENLKFRINKSDVVIVVEPKEEISEYKKINNLIVITSNKEKNKVYRMSELLNTMDIIYNDSKKYDYIGNRIYKLLA